MAIFSLPNETELLRLVAEGDERAFLKVYDHYGPALLNYAASRLADADDAADLVHDVFLKFWTSRENVQEIKPYLYALLRHRLIDFVRRNATRTIYADMIQALASEPEYNMESELDAKELQRTIDAAVAQLSERTRSIYELSRAENLSISEIAARLGISEQTVKNQITLAKNQLRAAASGASLLVILYLLY